MPGKVAGIFTKPYSLSSFRRKLSFQPRIVSGLLVRTFTRMNSSLQKQYDHLQGDFLSLISELDKFNAVKLETPPAPGKWSVTQVMFHLNQAESLSVLYVSKKKLGAAQLGKTGINASLRLLVARIAFYLPVKFNAPNVLGEMPAQVFYPEIKKNWTETRQRLHELLNSLKDEELRKPLFKQPTFGRWNIFQMLGFMQTHFNRHRKQIDRNIAT